MTNHIRVIKIVVILLLSILIITDIDARGKRGRRKKPVKKGPTKEEIERFEALYKTPYIVERRGRRDPFVSILKAIRKQKELETSRARQTNNTSGNKTVNPVPPKIDLEKLKAEYDKTKLSVEKLMKLHRYNEAEKNIKSSLKLIRPDEKTKKWINDLNKLLEKVKKEKEDWQRLANAVKNITIKGKIISKERSLAIINGKCVLVGAKLEGIGIEGVIFEKLTTTEAVFRYKNLTMSVKFGKRE